MEKRTKGRTQYLALAPRSWTLWGVEMLGVVSAPETVMEQHDPLYFVADSIQR